MKLLTKIEEIAQLDQAVSWALGFFDGVHRGHQALLKAAKKLAGTSAATGIITFAQHPKTQLCPQQAPLLLSPNNEEKLALLEQMGVDVVLMLTFDEQLRQQTPQEFLDHICAQAQPLGISIGHNCRFGAKGAGNADFLQNYAQLNNFTVQIVPILRDGNLQLSSTQARHTLAKGQMEQFAAILGRPFRLNGTVEKGQQLARQLGYPTANIRTHEQAALPPFGVYLARTQIQDKWQLGVASLGQRPSIKEEQKRTRLELHLLNWSGNLYGMQLDVELLSFIRAEKKFENIQALQAAIKQDVEEAKALSEKREYKK